MNAPTVEQALREWAEMLEPGDIVTDPREIAPYTASTSSVERHIPAVLRPTERAKIRDIVTVAQRCNVPLYPISTGNNWGYGSANPAVDSCVVVDLSLLKGIEIDGTLGIVSVEPGVTQGELSEHLIRSNLQYLVPVTGAGPNCSLVGNALERGYGITPYADHFAAVISLEAVLGDGSVYRGAMSEMGGHEVDRLFKWGIGPYVDGLFSQGAFGIVTRMTIALAPLPESVLAFIFEVGDDELLEEVVGAVRDLSRSLGAAIGSINVMNQERMLSMAAPFPATETSPGEAIPKAVVARLAKEYRAAPWTGLGAIYGHREIVAAARKIVKRRLKSKTSRLHFVNRRATKAAKRVLAHVPGAGAKRLTEMAERVEASLDILHGKPSEVALPLAYWRSGTTGDAPHRNPARDGCGLIWYAPLVPMRSDSVRTFVEMVRAICPSYGVDPLITLTSLSGRCFDSTVPILYDKRAPGAGERAIECFHALYEAGRQEGFVPYRLGLHAMSLATETDGRFWSLVAQIKSAVDPNGIISPGRYCPV